MRICTSIFNPLLIGGTGTTSPLTYKTTTGVGTAGADHIFQVGNNGATEAMRILNNGNVGIGTASPGVKLDVRDTSATNSILDIHSPSQVPYAQRIFNDTYSSSTPAFIYFPWNDGHFSMGTGAAKDFGLYINNGYGTPSINILGTSGQVSMGNNVIFGTDNTYDIGASGATRPS